MKLLKPFLLSFSFFLAAMVTARGQQTDTLTRKTKTDSLYRLKDSDPSKRFVPKVKKEKVYTADSTHSQHTAWTRSAMVPGWGQLYNHHWYKVPFIYAGLISLGYAIVTNQQQYKRFLAIARYQQLGQAAQITLNGVTTVNPRYVNDPYLNDYITIGDTYASRPQAIIDAKDGYYRNKEISILGFIAVWGVNVIDAYIYGKLQHSFTMDNNFSLKVSGSTLYQPVYASNFNTNFMPALKLTLIIK